MKPYWAKFGPIVGIRNILENAGKTWADMPTAGGLSAPNVCWHHQLGVCQMGGTCAREATHSKHLTDTEAAQAAAVLKDGVRKVVDSGTRARNHKRRKTGA